MRRIEPMLAVPAFRRWMRAILWPKSVARFDRWQIGILFLTGGAVGLLAGLAGPGQNVRRLEEVLLGGVLVGIVLAAVPTGVAVGGSVALAALRLHLWNEHVTVAPFVIIYALVVQWVRRGKWPVMDGPARWWIVWLGVLFAAFVRQLVLLQTPTFVPGFSAIASGLWFVIVEVAALGLYMWVREECTVSVYYVVLAFWCVVVLNGVLIGFNAAGVHVHWYFLTGAGFQGHRFGGTIEDYELAPEVLVLAATILLVEGRRFLPSWMLWAASVLAGISVVMSASRGPLIALGVAFLAWTVLSRRLWPLLCCAVILLGAVPLFRHAYVWTRIAHTHLVYGVVPGDRVAVWTNVIAAISRRPLLGYGPIVTQHINDFSQPHSLYLHLLYWGGPASLVAFMGGIMSVMWIVWKSVMPRWKRAILVAAMIFMCTDEVIIAMLRNEAATLLIFSIFGTLVGIARANRKVLCRRDCSTGGVVSERTAARPMDARG